MFSKAFGFIFKAIISFIVLIVSIKFLWVSIPIFIDRVVNIFNIIG